jgi:hypothetical protein
MHHTHHHGATAPGLAAPERAVLPAGLAPLGTAGDAPVGLSPPHKNECPGLAGGGAIRGQGKADASDCADLAAECKPLATLRARLALAGWALTTTPDNPHGAFTVSRWGMVRDLADLAAVAAYADRVGAP